MTEAQVFSDLKKKEKITGRFDFPVRRVFHKFQNEIKSARANFGMNAETRDTTVNFVSNSSSVVTTIAAFGAAAAPTFATGVFAAGIASPVGGVVLGVAGLAKLAYDWSSNRDAEHDKLIPYVWNLIDNEPPQINIYKNDVELAKALSSAMYLLHNANAQFKIMGSKLEAAQKKYNTFITIYFGKLNFLEGKKFEENLKLMQEMERNSLGQLVPYQAKIHLSTLSLYFDQWEDHRKQADRLWEEALKVNGAVYEYVRRLMHFGNYLQVAEIASAGIYSVGLTKNPGSLAWVAKSEGFAAENGDPLLQWAQTKTIREGFVKEGAKIKNMMDNYEKLVKLHDDIGANLQTKINAPQP